MPVVREFRSVDLPYFESMDFGGVWVGPFKGYFCRSAGVGMGCGVWRDLIGSFGCFHVGTGVSGFDRT